MRKLARLNDHSIKTRAECHADTGVAHKMTNEKSVVKSDCALKVKKPNFHYPERTDGSKHARELRERTNQISDKERAELFERAMRVIYGSRVKATVGAGH